MQLACLNCQTYNTDKCLSCKYINKLIGSADRGIKKKECLSSDGVVPSSKHIYNNANEVLYNNSKAIETMQYYMTCPDNHKAVIALYLAGFQKTKISDMISINRKTVTRILAVFD